LSQQASGCAHEIPVNIEAIMRSSGLERIAWVKCAIAVSGSPISNLTHPRDESCYTVPMKVEEIAEAVAKLPPDQLARFRRWFTAFEAGRTDHAGELDSAATKLGRLAGRAFADLKRRAKEP
jgi:hypothetical protein